MRIFEGRHQGPCAGAISRREILRMGALAGGPASTLLDHTGRPVALLDDRRKVEELG